MLGIFKLLFGGKGSTPVGLLAKEIREAIKGKEVDPNEALKLIHELNKAEAQHRSIFVAGARPFILWNCGFVIFFNFIVVPIVNWYDPALNPPELQLDALWPIMTGMLGVAGMRSYDKSRDRA